MERPPSLPQPWLRPEDIGINLDNVHFAADQGYNALELTRFLDQINNNQRNHNLPILPYSSNKQDLAATILEYFAEPEEPPRITSMRLQPRDIGINLTEISSVAGRGYTIGQLVEFAHQINDYQRRHNLPILQFSTNKAELAAMILEYFAEPPEDSDDEPPPLLRITPESIGVNPDLIRVEGVYSDDDIRNFWGKINQDRENRGLARLPRRQTYEQMRWDIYDYFTEEEVKPKPRLNLGAIGIDSTKVDPKRLNDGYSFNELLKFFNEINRLRLKHKLDPLPNSLAKSKFRLATVIRAYSEHQDWFDDIETNAKGELIYPELNLEEEVEIQPPNKETELFYNNLLILLGLNLFNITTFSNDCQKRDPTKNCLSLFEFGRKEYLRDPVYTGKSATKAMGNYLDLVFLPLFSVNAAETKLYEKGRKRVLETTKELEENFFDEDFDLQEFWQGYCRDYLEIEIEIQYVERFIGMLARAWRYNHYPSLDLIRYLIEVDNQYYYSVSLYEERTISSVRYSPVLDWEKFLERNHPRFKYPKLITGNDSKIILQKNSTKLLNICFRETEYPTPDGLVTIPFNLDLAYAMRDHFLNYTVEKIDSANNSDLFIKFNAKIKSIQETLSSFLY